MSKIIRIFLIFFSLKNTNLGVHFLITSLYFLKWCPIFDTSQLTQFSKFNNFLWVCWFLGKNLSNFVPPVWKLHNPYCHIGQVLVNIRICSFGIGCWIQWTKPKTTGSVKGQQVSEEFFIAFNFSKKQTKKFINYQK